MFRISRRLDYGLSLMIALAADADDRPQPTAAMAEKLNMPLPFMHQIAHSLMQAGLIKATPGPRGGLRLSRMAGDITVLQIVEALEGNISLNPEDKTVKGTPDQVAFATQAIWDDLQQKMLLHLSSINLEGLVNQSQQWMVFNKNFVTSPN
jgi:Rrf2 family protein